MFRQLAFQRMIVSTNEAAAAKEILCAHPFEIAFWLEAVWNNRLTVHSGTGSPDKRSTIAGLKIDSDLLKHLPAPLPAPRAFFRWDHLIYAYMIENTRVYEIFRRVLHELLHGEKLGTPKEEESVAWLRTTEELFYADSAPFFITKITSHIRPDLRATRRNAYQRMFGMDLNHGADDGKPYPYVKAETANGEFVATFEEFLREVWVGITYVPATSSANPTDTSKIAELAEKLHDMLRSRRHNGNLGREEFSAVCMMSWFHLTLEYDSAIVNSLRAESFGVEQRLFKIADRVGLPAHGLSKHFFDIADPLSRLLLLIETGELKEANAKDLYTGDTELVSDMRTIITHWTAITGHDVKARKVAA